MINKKAVIEELDTLCKRRDILKNNEEIIILQAGLVQEWLNVLKPIIKEMEDFLDLF